MPKKIYPNDPCWCGSGKKYKKCHGSNNKDFKFEKIEIDLDSLKRTDLMLPDFVIERLNEDIVYIHGLLHLILGPDGYSFCEKNKSDLKKQFYKDHFRDFTKHDRAGVYPRIEESLEVNHIKNIRPYEGTAPKKNHDILSLVEEGHISLTGYQVELFHAYLLENLMRRYNDYLYIPSDQCMSKQIFGLSAHRGYDFLLAITLYLELQLGIHLYFDKYRFQGYMHRIDLTDRFFEIESVDNISFGLEYVLSGYANAIMHITDFSMLMKELNIYNQIGAYSTGDFKNACEYYKHDPSNYKQGGAYIEYLKNLVISICLNSGAYMANAFLAWPECDFGKYIVGIELLVSLFEYKGKLHSLDKDTYENYNEVINLNKQFLEENDLTSPSLYHQTVFLLMDELHGLYNALKSNDYEYIDFSDITDDEFRAYQPNKNINPARKTTNINSPRKLRMEIYNELNGKFFSFSYFNDNGPDTLYGRYPILPWISNGKERTVHSRPYDLNNKKFDDLYSSDIEKRQDFLTMEYRLTEIPTNCISEYLNPDIYYNWKEKHELQLETQRQNEILTKNNIELNRLLKLNEHLVKNLSHSSANYLNSSQLSETGISLINADDYNPSIEQLHKDGFSLLLQSEQEMYLQRQLNSLVWRCAAKLDTLSRQIKEGLSKEQGVGIYEPFSFVLKTILARILFREQDLRSIFIRNKMEKKPNEWEQIKASFMINVLGNEDSVTNDWWNENIGVLHFDASEKWSNIKIVKDKAFYDLITEICTELLLNAISHGDISKPISFKFGHETNDKGRIRWTYIQCTNFEGSKYPSGREEGINSLNETMLLFNENSTGKGVEVDNSKGLFKTKVWLLAKYLRPY